MSHFKRYLFVIIVISSVVACSTKKNTAITRGYHNLTSNYNILFNGDESYKSGIQKLIENYDDDFSTLLPVFFYTDKNALSEIGAEMERTIKKATKLISMHSITVKPEMKPDKEMSSKEKEFYNKKEYNKYVDDTYLLMGKAHFYRMEIAQAKETFDYILTNYPESKTIYETNIWLARIACEGKKFKEAEDILQSLERNLEFPKRLRGELAATWADFYLKQERYREAIDPLLRAIDNTEHKYIRTRYHYILAQVYTLTDNNLKASQYFSRVIKMNPPYKMTFNAKINRALTYQSGAGTGKEIEKQLLKMLKDDKNIEFQDQVYYGLGNLYFTDKNLEKSIEYYKLSIQKSKTNLRQKARTSIKLADIFYNQPDYIMAQAYYDTAILVIDESYPGYDKIYKKSLNLTTLVENIKIYESEDSLLTLSYKSQDYINDLIDRLIDEEIRAEEDRKFQEAQLAEERLLNQNEIDLSINQNRGSWYFYNLSVKNAGQKEFIQKWGNRPLEDNWRRKNKNVISFDNFAGEEEENGEEIAATGTVVKDRKNRQFYLQYIPFSDSARQVSNKRIASSLLSIGDVYGNDLNDYPEAFEAYEEFLKRYPDSDNKLQVYYKLYNISKDAEDIDRVAKYQQRIVREFPNSNFARLMTNPDYLEEIRLQEAAVQEEYNALFSMFTAGNFNQAAPLSQKAMLAHPDHELYPKFDYIHIVSSGFQKDTLEFIRDLTELSKRYPSTDIAENAQMMIAYLQNTSPRIIVRQNKQLAEELYKYNPEEEHYFAFKTGSSTNTNQLIFNMVNFNLDYFDDLKLDVKKVSVGGKNSVCLSQTFKNSAEAMDYLLMIEKNEGIFKDVNPAGVVPIIISRNNYSKLLETGTLDQYLLFFNEKYR